MNGPDRRHGRHRTTRITFVATADQHAALLRLAARRGATISAVVRTAIDEYLTSRT